MAVLNSLLVLTRSELSSTHSVAPLSTEKPLREASVSAGQSAQTSVPVVGA